MKLSASIFYNCLCGVRLKGDFTFCRVVTLRRSPASALKISLFALYFTDNKQSSGQSPEVFNRNKFFFYLNENLRFSNFSCFTPRQASENSLIKEHLCPSGHKPLADQLLEMNLFTTKTLLLSLFITLHFSTAACGQENDQPMKPEDTEWYEPVPLVITPGGGTFLAHSGPLHAPRSEPWPPVFSPAALCGAPTPPVVTRLHCRLG